MWYDLVVFLILAFATYRGAKRGIVWQLAVIGSLVLCFVFAGTASLALSPYIKVKPPLDRWIAMFILYALFSFLAFGAARLVRDWIEKAKFVEFDRHLGALLGFLKGATFALFATFFAVTLSENVRAQVMNSYSGYGAAIVMDRLHPVMPAGLHDVLEPYIHQLDRPDMDLRHRHEHDDDEAHNPTTAIAHKDHDHDHDHGDHSHAETPQPEESAADPEDLFKEIVEVLPGLFDPELKQAAYDALRSTHEDDRGELIEKLSSGVPGLIRTVAYEWKNGKPDNAPAIRTEREDLLREISGTYSDFPAAQEAVQAEVEQSLAHLPDRVVLSVLRDWRADLLATRPDPDPQTGLTTPLDVRIVHQLSAARVAISSLPPEVQSRLRDSLPR